MGPIVRASARSRRDAGVLASVALATVALSACGGAAEEPGELVAVPYQEQEAPEDAAADPDPGAQEPAAPSEDGEASAAGASEAASMGDGAADGGVPLAAVRAFLDARDEGVAGRDHLLADLTEDGTQELAVATVGADGVTIEIARWNGDDLELAERRDVGPADGVGRLRLAELDGEASWLLLLPIRHEGSLQVAAWTPGERGGLRSPSDCPLGGVVALRSSVGQRHELRCEPGSASDALVWDEGSFRPQPLLDDSATSAVEGGRPGPGEGPNG